MLKNVEKIVFSVIIVCTLIFSWFWTEGFGLYFKDPYGKTIDQALNFWFQRGQSKVGSNTVIYQYPQQ